MAAFRFSKLLTDLSFQCVKPDLHYFALKFVENLSLYDILFTIDGLTYENAVRRYFL